jgi:hypothetical protein
MTTTSARGRRPRDVAAQPAGRDWPCRARPRPRCAHRRCAARRRTDRGATPRPCDSTVLVVLVRGSTARSGRSVNGRAQAPAHPMRSRYAAASRSVSCCPGRPVAAIAELTSRAPNSRRGRGQRLPSSTDARVGQDDVEVKLGCVLGQGGGWWPTAGSPRSPSRVQFEVEVSTRGPTSSSAARRSGTRTCGSTEVNHDPGPSTTQSASSIAAGSARGRTSGLGGLSRSLRTRRGWTPPGAGPHDGTSPGRVGSPPPTSASMSSGTPPSAAPGPARIQQLGRRGRGRPPCRRSVPERDDQQVAEGVPGKRAGPAEPVLQHVAPLCPHGVSSHSAASAIRRSPGGRTLNSSPQPPARSPVVGDSDDGRDPSVTRRSAASDAARPCPPPRATTLGRSFAPQVAVHGEGGGTSIVRASASRFGHRHRAVLAARAADSDRDIAAPLAQVALRDGLEHGCPCSTNSVAPGCAEHVVGHRGVQPP